MEYISTISLVLFFIAFVLSLQYRGDRTRKVFNSWYKTHFLIVEFMLENRDKVSGEVSRVDDLFGTEGLFNLSKIWTDSFENEYENKFKGELEYYDLVSEFCKKKNNE